MFCLLCEVVGVGILFLLLVLACVFSSGLSSLFNLELFVLVYWGC